MKTLFGLILLVLIVVGGYWLYGVYSSPEAPYWAQINSNLPGVLRDFACTKIGDKATPEAGCSSTH